MLLNADRASDLMDSHAVDAIIGTTLENVVYLSGHEGWVQRVYRSRMNFALLSRQPALVTDVVLNTGDITYFAARDGAVDRALAYGGQSALIVPDGYEAANDEEAAYLDLYRHAGRFRTPVDALAELIEQRGLTRSRIGFDDDGCTPDIRPRLQERFPDAEFVPAASLLLMIRAVKTPEEVEILRRAGEINRDAMEAMVAQLRPGMTESALAEIWRGEVARPGGMWHWLHFATGPRSVFVFPPVDRTVQHGDLFFVDAGIFYRNYNADGGLCGSVGEPSADALREFDAIRRGIEETVAIVRPGVTGGRIYDTMVESIRSNGFPEFGTNFAGHMIGLEAREIPFVFAPETPYADPFLPPSSEMPIPPGAVLNIEAPIGRMGVGGYQYEVSLVVTEDGSAPLFSHDPSFRILDV